MQRKIKMGLLKKRSTLLSSQNAFAILGKTAIRVVRIAVLVLVAFNFSLSPAYSQYDSGSELERDSALICHQPGGEIPCGPSLIDWYDNWLGEPLSAGAIAERLVISDPSAALGRFIELAHQIHDAIVNLAVLADQIESLDRQIREYEDELRRLEETKPWMNDYLPFRLQEYWDDINNWSIIKRATERVVASLKRKRDGKVQSLEDLRRTYGDLVREYDALWQRMGEEDQAWGDSIIDSAMEEIWSQYSIESVEDLLE
jgi:hypothetical protein